MPIPTTAAATTVRGWMIVCASGNPAPAALKRITITRATITPPTRPSNVAISPSAKASATIIRRTCLPEAPTARSRASSRSRWPMVIWKMLLMMNAATNAVMNAKIKRPVPNTSTNELTPSALSSATCSPVTTSVRSGSTSSMAACTAAGSASSVTLRSMASTRPAVVNRSSAVSRSMATTEAPPKLSASPSPKVELRIAS